MPKTLPMHKVISQNRYGSIEKLNGRINLTVGRVWLFSLSTRLLSTVNYLALTFGTCTGEILCL